MEFRSSCPARTRGRSAGSTSGCCSPGPDRLRRSGHLRRARRLLRPRGPVDQPARRLLLLDGEHHDHGLRRHPPRHRRGPVLHHAACHAGPRLFLIILVGTTLEILAERTRTAYRLRRWRRNLKDHTIICGYGAKGRSAIRPWWRRAPTPRDRRDRDRSFRSRRRHRQRVRRRRRQRVGAARAGGRRHPRGEGGRGCGGPGRRCGACHADGPELAPGAKIVASVREEENVHLLHQSGADSVITSSEPPGGSSGSPPRPPRRSRSSRTCSRSAGARHRPARDRS